MKLALQILLGLALGAAAFFVLVKVTYWLVEKFA
jgi:hypothetical protein